MRIDFVITELYVGGAEKCLTELALGLHRGGDDVRVFSIGSLPDGPRAAFSARLQNAGVPVQTAQADRSTQVFSAGRQLAQWIRDRPPQICQSFLFHANCLAAWVAKNAGASRTVGGLRVAEPRAIRLWLERRAVRRMDAMVCVSEAVREFSLNRLGCNPDRAHTISNGIDLQTVDDMLPIRWSDITPWQDDDDVIVFVGRLHKQKGIELLQAQIDRLAPADRNQRLLLVGDGPLESELRTWAERIGHHRCFVLPWQTEVVRILKSASLLVLPSHYEGMPNVVLEAMAAERPVVCSLVEGSEELLADTSLSQGFPPRDSGEMASRIERILADRDLSRRLAIQNRERVLERFSIEKMVQSYRALYEQLL